MKILVTGGAGFIGKHLVKALIKKNFQITIFDNFSNSNKKDLVKNPFKEAKIVVGDIKNYDEINKIIAEHDVVIHLAAKISVNESLSNPKETFEINVKGTENILKACIKQDIKKFIAFSSAAVYGNNTDQEHTSVENDILKPISPYGESKYEMEKKIIEISKKYKMNSIIFRLFNVYGEGQSKEYAGVISKFIDCIKNKNPFVVYGSGEQTRDFVSIDDIVNLILSILESKIKKYGEIYNLGTGNPTSILELAKMMQKIAANKEKIVFKESIHGDIVYSNASIKKAQIDLNYFPTITLNEGITKLLDYDNNL